MMLQRCFRIFIALTVAFAATLLNHASADDLLSDAELSVIAKLPTVPPRMNRGFRIARDPTQLVRTKLAVTITVPLFGAETWVFALPDMPNTSGQDVRQFSTSPLATEVIGKSAMRTPIRRCRIERTTDELKTTASFESDSEVLLYTRSLVFGRVARTRSAVEELSDDSRRLYLRPSIECDYMSDTFQTWKSANKFTRTPREGEIRFAQRVFRTLVTCYQYLYVPKQTRTASTLCQTEKTDCGGLSTLFAAVMRSEGIPARAMSGRWAKSATDGETVDGQRYYQYHVIAEFYANGVGWVPVDPSSAILHDKTEAKLAYFGQDPANFVVLHIDTGIEFDTELYGDYRAVYFQIPLFWVKGAGSLENQTLKEVWTVTAVSSTGSTNQQRSATNTGRKPRYVFLKIPHLRQAQNMCAPTSVSMALLYFGAKVPPLTIKTLANSVTEKPPFPGTYFEDIVNGLAKTGTNWNLRYFKTTDIGFDAGLKDIIASLDSGNPVIVDTNVPPNGHTVLINGYDRRRQLISIVDPLLAPPGLRHQTYVEFKASWRSLTADIRGAIFTSSPPTSRQNQ